VQQCQGLTLARFSLQNSRRGQEGCNHLGSGFEYNGSLAGSQPRLLQQG
jgi:hypothetical protein